MLGGWLRLGLGSGAGGDLLSCAVDAAAPEFGGEGAFGGCLLKMWAKVDPHDKSTPSS